MVVISFCGPAWLIGKVFTHSQGVLGSATLDPPGGNFIRQDTSEPQPSTGETKERHE